METTQSQTNQSSVTMVRLFISVVIALAVALVMAATSSQKAYAQDDPVTVNYEGFSFKVWFDGTEDAHSVELNGYSGDATQLVIPTSFEIDGKKYPCAEGDLYIGEGALANNTKLVKIAIPDGIFWVGSGAFKGCTSLTEIAIESDMLFGEGVFTGLKGVTYRLGATETFSTPEAIKSAGIGVDESGEIVEGVTVYVKAGSSTEKAFNELNAASTNGNKIEVKSVSDPYGTNTVKPDGSSGSNTGSGSGDDSGSKLVAVGIDGTAYGKGASETTVDKALVDYSNESDPKGTVFSLLKAKIVKVGNNSVTLTWTKVPGAKKYVVYGNQCGKGMKLVKQLNTKKVNITFKKVNKNKLAKGKYYKFVVVAIDKAGKVISTSKIVHAATSGGKYGNDKKVTTAAKKNKVTVKLKKKFNLKAKAIPASKKLKVARHRGVAYETTNPKVATVTEKGVVKGVKKGSCYVYAYAQNGVCAQIKVTVS